MPHPVIAIVGRPNVGKSRIFNRLVSKTQALVDDTSGVTRDRHYGHCEWEGRTYVVVDTGGLIPGSEDPLNKKVWDQAFAAIKEADAVVCVFDGQSGITPADQALIKDFHRLNKPKFFAVNKIDTAGQEKNAAEFARLGIAPIYPLSAEHGRRISDSAPSHRKVSHKEPDTSCAGRPGFAGSRNIRFLMSHPVIAIVGRPNVGKSRLFNRLVGRTQALVDDTSGVTRDRHYGHCEWAGKTFVVVDTGGLISGSEDPLNKKVWAQAFAAIGEADAVVCVFDGQTGITPADQALVKDFHKLNKPKFFVVNKIDTAGQEKVLADFASLGVEPLFAVSADHGRRVSDLMEALFDIGRQAPHVASPSYRGKGLAVALIGRPNVGKSTLLNRLAGEERVIVHEKAGTTRDSIDVWIERGGRSFVFIDTAGIKRKRATHGRLEKFTVIRTLKAMELAETVLFIMDAQEAATHQERHLLHAIHEAGKELLILVNKWDLAQADPKKYIAELRRHLGSLQDASILCISAKTGWNCEKIWRWLRPAPRVSQRHFK